MFKVLSSVLSAFCRVETSPLSLKYQYGQLALLSPVAKHDKSCLVGKSTRVVQGWMQSLYKIPIISSGLTLAELIKPCHSLHA